MGRCADVQPGQEASSTKPAEGAVLTSMPLPCTLCPGPGRPLYLYFPFLLWFLSSPSAFPSLQGHLWLFMPLVPEPLGQASAQVGPALVSRALDPKLEAICLSPC